MLNQSPVANKLTIILPKDSLERLIQAGVPINLIFAANIQVSTRIANLVTNVFKSAATTLRTTIYFHPKYFNMNSSSGLALIAHELIHILQWKRQGVFYLVRYCMEYVFYWCIYLYKKLKKVKLPANWLHDQVSYEKEAIAFEEKIRNLLLNIQ